MPLRLCTQDFEGERYAPLPLGFHHAAVTGIDVCVQRPIVVTASTGMLAPTTMTTRALSPNLHAFF